MSTLTQLLNVLDGALSELWFFALLPFVFSQIVTSPRSTTEPTPANEPSKPSAATEETILPAPIENSESELLASTINQIELELDKLQRRAEISQSAATGNINTLQQEKENNSKLGAGFISYLSGHADLLEQEQAAEYKNFLAAKETNDSLKLLRDGAEADPNTASLAKAKVLLASGDLKGATDTLTQLNEKLNSAGIELDYKSQLETLKNHREEYTKVDARIETAETVANYTRDGAVLTGAILSGGGAAGLAIASTGAVISNVAEQVGHVALENKTLSQAATDGAKQFGEDGILIGSVAGGIAGAKYAVGAGQTMLSKGALLAATGAATSVASESSQIGLQLATGERDSIGSVDLQNLAIAATGGAVGSTIGLSGGVAREAVSGALRKFGIVAAEGAADFSAVAAESVARSVAAGEELNSEILWDSGVNAARSLVLGETAAKARNLEISSGSKTATDQSNPRVDESAVKGSPRQIPVDAEYVQNLLDTKKIDHPIEIRDSNTQLNTRAIINSQRKLDEINQQLPGEKVYVGLDFNNMGPPNKEMGGKFKTDRQLDAGQEATLKKEVNLLLAKINDVAKQTLPEGSVIYRHGGDEIGIILPYDKDNPAATSAAVKDFIAGMEKARNEVLSLKDPRVIAAEKFGQLRSETRTIFKEAKDELGQDFSMPKYEKWITEKMLAEGFSAEDIASIRNNSKENGQEGDTGALVETLAQRRIDARGSEINEPSLMGLSAGVVRVGEKLTPETIHRAAAMADKVIKGTKEGAGEDLSVKEIPSDLRLRSSELEEIRAAQRVEQNFEETLNRFQNGEITPEHALGELIRWGAVDPSCDGNLRFGLVKDLTARDVYGTTEAKEMYLIEADITAFGAINNQLGAARGDSAYRAIEQTVSRHFGDEVKIRSNGGGLIVAVDPSRYQDFDTRLSSMKEELNAALKQQLAQDPGRVQAEFELRRALAEARGDLSESSREYGTVQVTNSLVTIDPNDTISTVFDKFSNAQNQTVQPPTRPADSGPGSQAGRSLHNRPFLSNNPNPAPSIVRYEQGREIKLPGENFETTGEMESFTYVRKGVYERVGGQMVTRIVDDPLYATVVDQQGAEYQIPHSIVAQYNQPTWKDLAVTAQNGARNFSQRVAHSADISSRLTLATAQTVGGIRPVVTNGHVEVVAYPYSHISPDPKQPQHSWHVGEDNIYVEKFKALQQEYAQRGETLKHISDADLAHLGIEKPSIYLSPSGTPQLLDHHRIWAAHHLGLGISVEVNTEVSSFN